MTLRPNLEDLSPKAKEALAPDASVRVREQAVAGRADGIPLRDRLALLVEFSRKKDYGVGLSTSCRSQFELLPATIVADALTSPQDPAVLHELAQSHAADGLAEVLLLAAPNIAEETLQLIAVTADVEICERIASDQKLISEHPQLVARLYMNVAARMSTVDRLRQWAEAQGIELDIQSADGPAEADVTRRKDARRRARQAAVPHQPPTEPEPPEPEPAVGPRAPRINLIGPASASASLPSGRQVLTWLQSQLDSWRKTGGDAPPEDVELEELGADPYIASYVRSLLKQIAELRDTIDGKNATIAALVEKRLI